MARIRVEGKTKKGLWERSRKARGLIGAGLIGAGALAVGLASRKPSAARDAFGKVNRLNKKLRAKPNIGRVLKTL